MRFSGIIVAAGSGSRAGGDKQWRRLGGRPVLRWSVEALLDAGADEVVVVVANGAQDRAAEALHGLEKWRAVAGGEALHLDLYRIGDVGELEFLGLDDVSATLWLIEWPERGAQALPRADLRIVLEQAGHGRRVTLEPVSATGRDWSSRVASRWELGPLT